MAGTTTQLRTLHLTNPLLKGRDVKALQRRLAPHKLGAAAGQCGPLTSAIERAKCALGYPKARCGGGLSFAAVVRGR
jgi:hypothetical protein